MSRVVRVRDDARQALHHPGGDVRGARADGAVGLVGAVLSGGSDVSPGTDAVEGVLVTGVVGGASQEQGGLRVVGDRPSVGDREGELPVGELSVGVEAVGRVGASLHNS